MAENSKIEWTDHTFNPVVGCTKVSAACDHCYAEGWAKRTGNAALWNGERRRTTPANWAKVSRWNMAGPGFKMMNGRRQRVFCASLADVFDNQWEPEWRADLWELIAATPNLDWLLLTKRPQNIRKMLPADWADNYRTKYRGVWLGTTAENQEEYERRFLGHLYDIPCTVQFVSYEPALGPLDIGGVYRPNWIICGGESGHGARMMDPAWARDLRDQCDHMGVAYFFKQMTGKKPIPDDLMVRQFPSAHLQ
jgi:protein gp37